jgi:NAD kinase
MSVLQPRVVIVTRPTDYQELLARHATRGQAEFFLRTRGQTIDTVIERHQKFERACARVKGSIPDAWRRVEVSRADLSRFMFADGDIVVAVGQDGLIANLAKYAIGRPVIGVNPEPPVIEGNLVQHSVETASTCLKSAASGDYDLERRVMVEATLEQGQTLLALNEIFVGHRSHQSARYRIKTGDAEEDHSSSGVIVASGTGMSGWARSIALATGNTQGLAPTDPAVAYFAREPWPSPATGTRLSSGRIDRQQRLELTSRMNEGGVIFADGIETDRMEFSWGMTVHIRPSEHTLDLVRRA